MPERVRIGQKVSPSSRPLQTWNIANSPPGNCNTISKPRLFQGILGIGRTYIPYMNHILHASNGPTKTEILALINSRVTLNVIRGMKGLPKIFHFLLKKNIHTLFSRPVWTYLTCSSPRRPLFLHALSFECTSKLCVNFINQFSFYFHI